MHSAVPPQLQFEFADASQRDGKPRSSRRLLTRAREVRAALGSLAYEATWAHLLRTSSRATQHMGWQLLSYSRPQVRLLFILVWLHHAVCWVCGSRPQVHLHSRRID